MRSNRYTATLWNFYGNICGTTAVHLQKSVNIRENTASAMRTGKGKWTVACGESIRRIALKLIWNHVWFNLSSPVKFCDYWINLPDAKKYTRIFIMRKYSTFFRLTPYNKNCWKKRLKNFRLRHQLPISYLTRDIY